MFCKRDPRLQTARLERMCTRVVLTREKVVSQTKPEKGSPTLRVGVREFRGNMTGFLRQARQGASFLITSHDEVVAELHPPSTPKPPRRLVGAMRGQIWMAPDFDTWPDDILDAMEGKGE